MNKMFRVCIIDKYGQPKSENKETLNECYDYILSFVNPKHYRIMDKVTGNILEDENGQRA
jgi:hypothetical protein